MGQLPKKNYLNGLFVDKKQGNYGDFFSIWVPDIDAFINNLKAMPVVAHTNPKTGVTTKSMRLTMTEQVTPGKMSVYLDTWQPTNSAQPAANTASNPRTPVTDSMMAGVDSDLPF